MFDSQMLVCQLCHHRPFGVRLISRSLPDTVHIRPRWFRHPHRSLPPACPADRSARKFSDHRHQNVPVILIEPHLVNLQQIQCKGRFSPLKSGRRILPARNRARALTAGSPDAGFRASVSPSRKHLPHRSPPQVSMPNAG